jgi:hypothetical protein
MQKRFLARLLLLISKVPILTEATNFSSLVHEAFIEPLRSVLIVDDQYPTWDEILNERLNDENKNAALSSRSTGKDWQSDPTGPIKVIQQFREQKPGLIIDIHDALTPSDVEQTDHLHQSDLLVLDYNLEGDQSGLGGTRARTILQSVLSNKHFNLVVVHTGEDVLSDVFSDCLLGLMTNCTSQFDDAVNKDLAALDEKLDELGDKDKFDSKLLSEKFGMKEYLVLRQPTTNLNNTLRQFMKSEGDFATISNWGKDTGLNGKDLKTFFYWAIREFEKTKSTMFGDDTLEGLKWKCTDECMWLRTVRGFVTFVEKGPEDLLGALQSALENWQPTPSRLISAKYRHELSSVGVEAEDRTLLKAHVFAHFYKDFCAPTRDDLTDEEGERLRTAKLKAHVTRQSESIAFHIEDEVVRFGEKIRQIDEETGAGFAAHYGISLEEKDAAEAQKAIAHYNSYVSTLPLKSEDEQLDSGHIFKWNSEWWVCATPACDLQPGQNTTAFIGTSSKQRPFTALRLLPVPTNQVTPDHINSGLFCFVEQSPSDVICLGVEAIDSSTSVTNGKATWRTFVAAENGHIVENKMQLVVPKFVKGKLTLEPNQEAEIVAKLRYEYALNYIQRVGTSVTRIGLGYLS